jgi:Domain of unknown function (DUF4214)
MAAHHGTLHSTLLALEDVNMLMALQISQFELERLLTLDGEAFVKGAYRALLGRDPDPPGLANYLTELNDHRPKEAVLLELQQSPEGLLHSRRRQSASMAQGLTAQPPALAAKSVAAEDLPKTVDELLLLPNAKFFSAAYQTILGREIDPTGLVIYSRLLRAGWSRLYVLRELAHSEEAREANKALPGLKAALDNYAKAQRPSVRGWIWREIKGIESDLPRDRQIRAIFEAVKGFWA